MKNFNYLLVMSVLAISCGSLSKPKINEGICMNHPSTNKEMKVMTPSELPSNPGPAEYFTGSVRVTPLAAGEEPSCLSCGWVNFAPGARSNWHTHPRGQLLVVTEGSGLIQEWGKPIQRIKKGDVIWTPPGVKHWHGASPTTSLTHAAIQESKDGKNVEWLERVTDEEYAKQ